MRLTRPAVALVGVISMFAAGSAAHADEGMWTIDNFPSERVADTYGRTLDAAALGQLSQATVRIEGGCTGSFVSPDGLILTNHHCIQRCLTQWSGGDTDRRKDGFVASGREDELKCSSEQVSVLVGAEEVTATVNEAIDGLAVDEANKVRKSALTRLEKACRERHSDAGLTCEAVSLYEGGQVFIYRYQRYNDVRLVFAPEQAIAAFGGDPDNFNFPRWCLDMALLRAYVDDKPAKSPRFLPIRRAGAEPGEVVFVAGHPGRTDRLKTSDYWLLLRDTVLPADIEYYAELRGRLKYFSTTSAAAARDAAPVLLGIENGLKVRRQRLRALLSEEQLKAKQDAEATLRQAAVRAETFSDELDVAARQAREATGQYRLFFTRYALVEKRQGFGGALYGYAKALVRAAIEREKPEAKRLRAYTEAGLNRLQPRILAERPINADLETLRLAYGLDKMLERLGPDDYFVKMTLGNRAPEAMAAALVEETALADASVRKALWDGGLAAIETSDDPLIQLALAVEPESRALRTRYSDTVEAPLLAAESAIARARFALYGTDTYPDATFSLRISYGAVHGWREGENDIDPYTTLAELAPRVTGAAPFALPPRWLETDIDPATRFNLVSTTDIIGGNSGSSLTNADGELVGLAFDGNIHAIPGAYFYDADVNRTVSVHAAIMLAALENVYAADWLIGELEIR